MENTEKFRIRKYSKQTGTNIYAAPMQVNLQPCKTSQRSISQRSMKSLTHGQNSAQTFTTNGLMGTQWYLIFNTYRLKSITLIYEKEVEAAVKALKTLKNQLEWITGPAKLAQAGWEAMTDVLTSVCNKILKMKERPTT